MQKIRSIQVVNVRWFNATAWYGMFLARLLQNSGHPTLVLGLPGTASFAKAKEWGLDIHGVNLNEKNPLKLAATYKDLYKIVKDFKPDIVNCHRGEGFLLWPALKKAHPFALVRTRGDQRQPKKGIANRLLYAKAAGLIATNSITARSFTHDLMVPPERVSTIIGGVDNSAFYPDIEAGRNVREALGFAEDDFVIGLLGRLDPVKGYDVLIKAVRELKREHNQDKRIRLLCIGADASFTEDDLRGELNQAGILADSIVTGRVNNVRAYINALDIGVLASTASEAIARAALEIMACGVPLLSSDVGVMPDILPQYLLVPKGDSIALAYALHDYYKNKEKLETLAQHCTTAVNKLKSEDFLEKTLHAYANCFN